ncbi:Lrp/AsnC family transcriptional regulator [Aliikangiella coralliicola]|uniref:Lrp/AsnC family transcriptional regulator n=1 Tax=Aliikangiella coralliicola TaxID=2592383 RepID=A0A545UEP5_9GAMM|nr:Lrp/AsnC family transcriptional regulator [Aliikangiella coralliicola]TQV87942.1 Lrp/AsnC family transcriptional regulator [Aliikangiella coralliicola]
MQNIDDIDRQLIGHLRNNGRAPVAWLAKSIGVSRATIQNRMKRLEKRGLITGYTALVSAGADEQLSIVNALMSIELEGNVFKKVQESLISEPSVRAIHSTNGRWDIIVEIQTPSLEEFDRVLKRVRSIVGISSSETSLLLSSRRMGAAKL